MGLYYCLKGGMTYFMGQNLNPGRNSGTEGVCSKFHAAASGTMVLIGSLVFDSSVACRLSTACRAEWLIEAYSEELTSSAYTEAILLDTDQWD